MHRTCSSQLKTLGLEIRIATLSLKIDVALSALERRYRPDQPRAPSGTSQGGQWIDDLSIVSTTRETERTLIAGLRCDGFSSGCQLGGTFGTTGMFQIFGKNLCRACALKILGIESLPHDEQQKTLSGFDPKTR